MAQRVISEGMPDEVFRWVDKFTLKIPALPRPTLPELQARFPWIESKQDTSPKEALTLRFASVLLLNEEKIGGAKYERRLGPKLKLNLCLGYQHAIWLEEHYGKSLSFVALLKKFYVDFPGLVVAGESGRRYISGLSWVGAQVDLCWGYLGHGASQRGCFALLSSKSR